MHPSIELGVIYCVLRSSSSADVYMYMTEYRLTRPLVIRVIYSGFMYGRLISSPFQLNFRPNSNFQRYTVF